MAARVGRRDVAAGVPVSGFFTPSSCLLASCVQFHSPLLQSSDFNAKPMVLLLGQYSVGKTSFIRYLLGRDYPGIRIGV